MDQQGAAQTATIQAAHPAERSTRVGAYLIDCLPCLLALTVMWIPLIGIVIAGFFLTPYWLLRDITGASPGKKTLGLRVIGKDGAPATKGALVLRNVPLAIGPACMMIPLAGYFIAGPVAFVMVLIEAILLGSAEGRLGDRWAKTRVVVR